MYGLIFFQLSNDQEGIQNINALIFLSVVYSSVIYLFTEVKVDIAYLLIFITFYLLIWDFFNCFLL